MKVRSLFLVLLGGLAVHVALSVRGGVTPVSREILEPVPPVQAADRSGSRLKLRHVTGADGSRLDRPEVLRDTTLSIDCTFALASDGTQRCLPILSESSSSNVRFRDSGCQQRAIWVSAPPLGCTLTPPRYAFQQQVPPGCPSNDPPVTRVYRVENLILPAPPNYYALTSQGFCQSYGAGSGSFAVYALSDEVPPSTFVQGTAGLDP